jgi:acetyl esterase/lipase
MHLVMLTLSLTLFAADGAPKAEPLWPKAAPGALGDKAADIPTLTAFLPAADKASGAAVVICPGGGYGGLAMSYEGLDVGAWMAKRGVAGFVLKYRVAPYKHPVPLQDAQRALRTVRARAKEWGVDPARVGILGFSAGGVVVTGISLQHDAKSRPDFAGAIYPVPWDIGKVPKDAPPLFIAAASDDALTDIGAKPLQAAWQQAGHPVETHIYDKGGHGFGMKQQDSDSDHWIDQFGEWLDKQGLLKAKK